MKRFILSVALLGSVWVSASNSRNEIVLPFENETVLESDVMEEVFAIVCVKYMVTGAGPNPAYFYTLECALLYQDNFPPGTTTLHTNGPYCVGEQFVYICL